MLPSDLVLILQAGEDLEDDLGLECAPGAGPSTGSRHGTTGVTARGQQSDSPVLGGLKGQNSSVSCDLRTRRSRSYGDATRPGDDPCPYRRRQGPQGQPEA